MRQSDPQEVTRPKSYPHSVRRQISHRLRAGDAVADIATETGISAATLFRWKDQALVDVGVRDGVPSIESDELASARVRIAALEAELVLTRDACALFSRSVGGAPRKEDRDRRRTDHTKSFQQNGMPDNRFE